MNFRISPEPEAFCNGVGTHRSPFLLSIDGGGIRGLSSLIILREVLYRIQTRGNLDIIPRPCDLFDLAGGTGTGGLIILMLFRLKMTIDEAIETYVQFTKDVFHKQQNWFMEEAFSADDFERAIVRILRKYNEFANNPLEVRLLDSNLEEHGKAFLCAYSARNMAFPVLFRTYMVPKNLSYNCTIVEGARATCATPKIFKSIDIGPDYLRSTYIGGEWRSNNPTQSVLLEASVLFPSQPICCLLSIGTGRINNLAFDIPFKLDQVLKNISEDCETTHQRIAQQFNLDVYFRLNVEQGLRQVSWMDWKNLPAVEAHTKQYLMEAEISQRVDLLVEKFLMSKVEPRNSTSDQGTVQGAVGSLIMQAPRDADVYRNRLLVEKRGLPLWIPGPDMSLPIAYRRTGITIGDVGVISAAGDFDFLFNIFCPADHTVNEGRVPAAFCPLDIPNLKFKEHVLFDRKSYLASAFLCKPSDRTPNGFIFETSEKEGAVLVMPDGALSQDILFHRRTIAKYISANARMWYEYAGGDQCGLEIHNGDLRVVCGIDKATSWAIATLKMDIVEEPSTQLEFVAVDQPGPSEAYRWETVGRARGRVGPPQDEMRDLVRATGEDTLRNQCLFVRTFNFNFSGQLWDDLGISPLLSSNVKNNVSDQQQAPTNHHHNSTAGSSMQSTTTSGQEYQGSNANFMNFEQLVQHPSVMLNKRLLEMHPNAAMVITEDADWIAGIADTDITIPSPEVIFSRVLASHEVLVEDGVITLRVITKATGEENKDFSESVGMVEGFNHEWQFIYDPPEFPIFFPSFISGTAQEEIQESGNTNQDLKEYPPLKPPTGDAVASPSHSSPVVMSSSTPVDRPRHRKITKEAKDHLKAWLHRHSDHPYPSEEEQEQLCNATGLSKRQVSVWMTRATTSPARSASLSGMDPMSASMPGSPAEALQSVPSVDLGMHTSGQGSSSGHTSMENPLLYNAFYSPYDYSLGGPGRYRSRSNSNKSGSATPPYGHQSM